MPESVPLGVLDRSVPSGSHVCAFYGGPAGRDEVVLPFLAEGLRSGPDARAEFLRYEARFTGCISGFPQVVVCLYDLGRFGAEVLMDVLRTHSMVIMDGSIHDNPYHIEPGQFLCGAG